ncbi:MAG TPA: hypothetical protein PKW35_08555 [Nannocystaceae bacterium]|nr:hypothetical protein [Nannocystaceae bacterium]
MIPVANLWAMLAFHWEPFADAPLAGAHGLHADTPVDLLARLLDRAVDRLRRRGLALTYTPLTEEGSRIRGALDLQTTIARALPSRGQAASRVDELTPDVPANRVIKAALRALLRDSTLSQRLAGALRTHLNAFTEVAEVAPRPDLAARTPCPRGHLHYPLLLDLCDFILGHLLPAPGDDPRRLRDFTRDEVAMRRLFEGFVRNFARHHLTRRGYWVSTNRNGDNHLQWFAAGDPSTLTHLPKMITDVVIDDPTGARLIVECKYVREPIHARTHHYKLRPDHLYQLFAYLQNTRLRAEAPDLRGLLLYASPGLALDLTFTLGGIPLRVHALDLAVPWPDLEATLLHALAPSPPESPMSETRPR